MSYDFSEFDTEGEEEAPEALNEATQTPEAFDEHMSEVEKRLEVASYYRLLLNDSLFNDNTDAAKAVDKEIKAFIRTRLGILLNVTQEEKPTVQLFSEQEVAALKALAAKVMGKPAILLPKAPAKAPELKKPVAPAPAIKKVATPAPALPKAPERAKSGPRPGRRYKVVENPDTGKKVRMDITGQAGMSRSNPNAIPMPTNMSAVTAMKAAEAAQLNSNADQITANATNAIIKGAM